MKKPSTSITYRMLPKNLAALRASPDTVVRPIEDYRETDEIFWPNDTFEIHADEPGGDGSPPEAIRCLVAAAFEAATSPAVRRRLHHGQALAVESGGLRCAKPTYPRLPAPMRPALRSAGRRRGITNALTIMGSVSPSRVRSWTSSLMTIRIFIISWATKVQFSPRLICSCMMASASRMLTRNALITLRISLMRLSMWPFSLLGAQHKNKT
jgi:hypothetical protein